MRFNKAFQLIALALVFSITQVYVMAGPVRAITDPKSNGASPSANSPKSEAAVAETSSTEVASVTTISTDSQLLTAKAAAERMPLMGSSKTTLGRIFSKGDLTARAAAGNTFLKANTSPANIFKSSASPTQTSNDNKSADEGGGGSRGTWIAVGVIAAVLTLAIIALRHDRSHPN